MVGDRANFDQYFPGNNFHLMTPEEMEPLQELARKHIKKNVEEPKQAELLDILGL